MANNHKYTKQTRHISMIINFVRNGEECNLYNAVWCAGGMQVVDVGTNNVREEEFNHVLGYTMARLYNL